MYCAIKVEYIGPSNTRAGRLKATTMSERPVSKTVEYDHSLSGSDARYLAALAALLEKLGDGWGKPSDYVVGATSTGQVYVRPEVSR